MDFTPNSRISFAVIATLIAGSWAIYSEASVFKERLTEVEKNAAVDSYKAQLMTNDINGFKTDIERLRNGQNNINRKQDVLIALIEDLRNGKTKVQ